MDIAHLSIIVMVLTIGSMLVGVVRWLTIHYLHELRPNNGGSIKDQVNRLEKRVDDIYAILAEMNTRRWS